MTEAEAREFETTVSGVAIRGLREGSGAPLVILHHSFGNPGWLALHADLAADHTVLAPDLPGYGDSSRPTWARDPRDLAILLSQWIDRERIAGPHLVGLGFGGFVAAELASMRPAAVASLVLVGAAGLPPREGRIVDQFLISHLDYVRAAFARDERYEQVYGKSLSEETLAVWDRNREMTTRVGWRPYMLNRRLTPLLAEVKVPALVVHGADDGIVPRCCAEQYVEALPDARLELVAGCGHAVDMEEPHVLAKLVREHVAAV